MISSYVLFVSLACVNLSRQADVPLEGHPIKEYGGQTSGNVSATEPSLDEFVEENTYKPFRQNGSYPGSVTTLDPPNNGTPPLLPVEPESVFNGTQVPPDHQPPSQQGYPIFAGTQDQPTRPESTGHSIFNDSQVPLSEEQSGEGLIYQWHVGIYSKAFTPYKQICGGTLISLKAVISAAHCFWSDLEGVLSATQFVVGTGKRYRPLFDPKDKYTQKSEVSAVHIPPRFRGASTSFQGDIAVVLLASSFRRTPSVKPACVSFDEGFDRQQLRKGKIGTVLGWGLTEEDGGPSPILNYIELPFVDIDDCLSTAADDFLKYITADKICAGVTTGKALCRGDSGGGWVVYDDSHPPTPYLHGVASTAARNEHQCNAYALAALTHVLSHRTFLTQFLPGLENECRLHYPQISNISDTQMGSKLAKYRGGKTGKKKFVCNCYCNNKKT